jgi:hypothetical protein
MKILYSIGNRFGASVQFSRFIQNIPSDYEVKVCGFYKPTYKLPKIDWILDSLYDIKPYFRKKRYFEINATNIGTKSVIYKRLDRLTQEIEEYNPDLTIVDGECVIPIVTQKLGKETWFCSPDHLFDGTDFITKKKYHSLFEGFRKRLYRVPKPSRYLIYSPFGDFKSAPKLNPGFEWVRPYYVEQKESENKYDYVSIIDNIERFPNLLRMLNGSDYLGKIAYYNNENFNRIHYCSNNNLNEYSEMLGQSDRVFSFGETDYVADAIYNGKTIYIAPTLLEPETLMNAVFVDRMKIGKDLSQIELKGKHSLFYFENAFNLTAPTNYLNNKLNKQLHEEI